MTVNDITNSARKQLIPLYGSREAEAMLRLVWEHLRGWQPVDIILHRDEEIGLSLTNDLDAILARLLKGEPIQYILGEARFFGLNLKVNSSVLIPRPETEGLVQLIVDEYGSRSDLKVLDICTGSGAIAIALARHLPFSQVTATDISGEALKVAEENVKSLNLRIRFVEEDILSSAKIDSTYDIIVSNPPYVLESEKDRMKSNVLNYEPSEAIFAPKDDDIAFYREISRKAYDALTPGGELYFELNPLTATEVKSYVEKVGFDDVETLPDIHGRIRYLKARKPNR